LVGGLGATHEFSLGGFLGSGPVDPLAAVARRESRCPGVAFDAAQLRSHAGRPRKGVVLTATQQLPGKARDLAGHSYGRDLCSTACTDPFAERSQRTRLAQSDPGSLHEHRPSLGVAALRDAAVARWLITRLANLGI
jgi:hypothetical protein